MQQRARSDTLTSEIASIVSDNQPLYYCDRLKNGITPNQNRRAEKALIFASCFTVVFICAEMTGGILANSLAIMTDAGHMFSDLTSFLISLMAIRLARRQPTQRLSFGFHRAEVLGALTSILIIWALTAILVYLAIHRVIDRDYTIDADMMLITGGIAIIFNIIMGIVLYFGKAPHSHFGGGHHHGHDNDHHHSHDHDHHDAESAHSHEKDGGHNNIAFRKPSLSPSKSSSSSGSSDDGHQHGHGHEQHSNLNVRAAFIHVLGDLVQSIGVMIAAVIIKFTGWELADPICTFIFSILVLITTVTVLRDTLLVLMEAAPRHLDLSGLQRDLLAIHGVRGVHSLRVWSLTTDKTAASVHLETAIDADSDTTVHAANALFQQKYGLHFVTVQVQCCSRTRQASICSQPSLPLISLPNGNHVDHACRF